MNEQLRIPKGFSFRGEAPSPDPECTSKVRLYTHQRTGMEFVLIPGGVGQIGANDGPHSMQPKHRVSVEPFLMGRYPVTLGQWRDVMGDGSIQGSFSPERQSVDGLGDAYPVADISWLQAKDFCERTGFQLPSEAQWEYACRAGCEEDDFGDVDDCAWHHDNSESHDIQPVGLKRPNAFGLHDMLGNVWEWCADTWHDSYAGAPLNDVAWVDGTSQSRVARGGSVEYGADSCTPFERKPFPSGLSIGSEGFRVMCSLEWSENEDVGSVSVGVAIPNGFKSLGVRRLEFNGVAYELEWIEHVLTGIELLLLPGGVYDAGNLECLWQQVDVLFSEDVIVTDQAASHPELLNWLLSRNMEVYPVLVARFFMDDSEVRLGGAFWHAQQGIMQLRGTDLPDAMPSAEVFHAALQEKDSMIRGMAALTFGGFSEHSKPYLPALVALLDDSECCGIIMETLGHIGARTAEAAVVAIVKIAVGHNNAEVRGQAIETLEKMSWEGLDAVSVEVKKQVVPILLSLINSDDDSGRKTAARCLGLLGTGTDVSDALSHCLSDAKADVREVARWALERLSSPEEGLGGLGN